MVGTQGILIDSHKLRDSGLISCSAGGLKCQLRLFKRIEGVSSYLFLGLRVQFPGPRAPLIRCPFSSLFLSDGYLVDVSSKVSDDASR